MWVDFSLSNMKVLHAQWTVNSYEKLRNRKDLLRSAWVQTGLWAILQGTFTPKKDVPRVYEIPSEENDEPPYDSESEYTSGSYHSSNEDFENAESDVEDDIPVPRQTPAQAKKRARKVVLESSDEELPQSKKATVARHKTATLS